jgi:Calponin homology (CH) domain
VLLPLPSPTALDYGSDLQGALAAWSQAVCHGYGVPVRNFTTSFADGRALCILVHHYHPMLLPLQAVHRTTAHLPRKPGVEVQQADLVVKLSL